MNYGLYLSASGVLTNSYRQDVFANNLANVETVGFKPDLPSISQRPAAAVDPRNSGSDAPRHLLDQLGGGVWAGPQAIRFAQGQLRATGNPLDVALEAPNAFLSVSQTDPNTGKSATFLTRDGRLTRDAKGFLVTTAGGHRVLGPGDMPIALDSDAPVTIDSAGRIVQNGQPVAQIQVATVSDTTQLHKVGQSLFGWSSNKDPRQTNGSATVKAGFVESSGVDPIRALMDVIDATKAANGSANLIRYHDAMLDRAVNTLGRVA